jgi:hypothetical protein
VWLSMNSAMAASFRRWADHVSAADPTQPAHVGLTAAHIRSNCGIRREWSWIAWVAPGHDTAHRRNLRFNQPP